MQNLAYDWNAILQTVAVRNHPLYSNLETADFGSIVDYFQAGRSPYDELADYLLYGVAAVLGRHREAAEKVLQYHSRLNAKTKAVTLFFWAQEAAAHLQYETAESFVKPLLERHAHDPELNLIMANCCFYRQDLPRGWPYLKAGLASAPNHIALNGLLSRYHLHDGNMKDVEETAWHLLRLDPVNPSGFNILSRVAPEKVDDRLVERFEHRALEGQLGPVNSAGLLFDIGRIYDARGAYGKAFEAIEQANLLTRSIPQIAGQVFDDIDEFRRFSERRMLFETLEPLPGDNDITPVFIVGLPRTGSTLLDQAMAAHPDVMSLGENDIIPTLAEEAATLLADGKHETAQARMKEWRQRFFDRVADLAVDPQDRSVRFVVDKMLGNSRYLGFLCKLFPTAKFLHCQRNMMDVGLSIYFSPLLRTNVYATDLTSIADFIAVDQRIIKAAAEGGITPLPVAYEDMVDDMEGTLRGVFAHIGLDWHADCLNFNKKKRAVHTYSAHQVRRAVYKSSKGRWQNYANQLAPFQDALERRGLVGGREVSL